MRYERQHGESKRMNEKIDRMQIMGNSLIWFDSMICKTCSLIGLSSWQLAIRVSCCYQNFNIAAVYHNVDGHIKLRMFQLIQNDHHYICFPCIQNEGASFHLCGWVSNEFQIGGQGKGEVAILEKYSNEAQPNVAVTEGVCWIIPETWK